MLQHKDKFSLHILNWKGKCVYWPHLFPRNSGGPIFQTSMLCPGFIPYKKPKTEYLPSGWRSVFNSPCCLDKAFITRA